MDKKGSIIIAIAIIIGFLLLGIILKSPIESNSVNFSSEANRYQMVTPNDNNIIIFDTKTGDYWRKFIPANEGPTEWEKEFSPQLND